MSSAAVDNAAAKANVWETPGGVCAASKMRMHEVEASSRCTTLVKDVCKSAVALQAEPQVLHSFPSSVQNVRPRRVAYNSWEPLQESLITQD